MDLTIYPKTRIARLPKRLQPPAVLLRNLVYRQPKYVYAQDGLATIHHSPFLEDTEFDAMYWRVEADWFPNWHADLRWRVWLLTRLARHARSLPGNFAELGVFRGGTAYMTLACAELRDDQKMHLFDTFAGTPTEGLTANERASKLGRSHWSYDETSSAYVADVLREFSDRVVFHEGRVEETLPGSDVGALAFVHLDLNASAPTRTALEHVYPRLVAGAAMVFDDYGDSRYQDQRAVIDEFFAGKPEEPIALPTAQAFVIIAPH